MKFTAVGSGTTGGEPVLTSSASTQHSLCILSLGARLYLAICQQTCVDLEIDRVEFDIET